MTERDVVWYGRAAVWVGAALLLLMAFTGAQIAVVSILSVLGIITGTIMLLYAGPFGTQSRRKTNGNVDGPDALS